MAYLDLRLARLTTIRTRFHPLSATATGAMTLPFAFLLRKLQAARETKPPAAILMNQSPPHTSQEKHRNILLDLPAELRNKIYDYVSCDSASVLAVLIPFQEHKHAEQRLGIKLRNLAVAYRRNKARTQIMERHDEARQSRPNRLALLRVCKQIHKEAT